MDRTGRGGRYTCTHCGRLGHERSCCYQLNGYPADWPHQRKHAQRPATAAPASSLSDHSGTQPPPSYFAGELQSLRSQIDFLMRDRPPSSSAAVATGPYHTDVSSGTPSTHHVSPSTWLIDSGASMHMTGDSRLFTCMSPVATPPAVRLADGSLTPITGPEFQEDFGQGV